MKRYLKPVVMIMLAFSLAGCADQIQDEETQAQTLPIEESDAPLLAEGEKITIDGECEFQVDYVRISENPEHYYEAETGKTCVDFCLTYKNLADYTVNASNVMKGKLIFSRFPFPKPVCLPEFLFIQFIPDDNIIITIPFKRFCEYAFRI